MPAFTRIAIAILLAGLLCGCASQPKRLSASGKAVTREDVDVAKTRVVRENIPETIQPYFVSLYSEGQQNSVLHAMRGGLAAIRIGDFELARRTFDRALGEVETMQEGSEQAERAKSVFVGDREKWFKGENHERAALFLYRGFLYLQTGDFQNAAAVFKRAQLQDLAGEDASQFTADWVCSEIGLAVASWKAGNPAEAERALLRLHGFPTWNPKIALPTVRTSFLLVVESGSGPVKFVTGEQGQNLVYAEPPNRVSGIRVLHQYISPNKPLISPPTEQIFVQATTRGTRKLDGILERKAGFKEATGNAALALAAGAVVASQADDSGYVAGGLAGAAFVAAIISSSSDAAADVRNWDNLPDHLYLIPLDIPPNSTELSVQALGENGEVLNTFTTRNVSTTPQLGIAFLRI